MTLPKKIEDLLELGRANGWTVETEPYDETIEGLAEAVGLGFARTIDDGRTLSFVTAYGKRAEGRGSWILLEDEKGFSVFAEVDDPAVPDLLGPDLSRRWKAVSDLRYWLENSDELLELWRTSSALRPRRSLRDRLTSDRSSR